jgi:hypothetical protein
MGMDGESRLQEIAFVGAKSSWPWTWRGDGVDGVCLELFRLVSVHYSNPHAHDIEAP